MQNLLTQVEEKSNKIIEVAKRNLEIAVSHKNNNFIVAPEVNVKDLITKGERLTAFQDTRSNSVKVTYTLIMWNKQLHIMQEDMFHPVTIYKEVTKC